MKQKFDESIHFRNSRHLAVFARKFEFDEVTEGGLLTFLHRKTWNILELRTIVLLVKLHSVWRPSYDHTSNGTAVPFNVCLLRRLGRRYCITSRGSPKSSDNGEQECATVTWTRLTFASAWFPLLIGISLWSWYKYLAMQLVLLITFGMFFSCVSMCACLWEPLLCVLSEIECVIWCTYCKFLECCSLQRVESVEEWLSQVSWRCQRSSLLGSSCTCWERWRASTQRLDAVSWSCKCSSSSGKVKKNPLSNKRLQGK